MKTGNIMVEAGEYGIFDAETGLEEPAPEPFIVPELEKWCRFLESRKGRVNPRSIGRNEKCPCGSGKKLKKCCKEFDNRKFVDIVEAIHLAGREAAGLEDMMGTDEEILAAVDANIERLAEEKRRRDAEAEERRRAALAKLPQHDLPFRGRHRPLSGLMTLAAAAMMPPAGGGHRKR